MAMLVITRGYTVNLHPVQDRESWTPLEEPRPSRPRLPGCNGRCSGGRSREGGWPHVQRRLPEVSAAVRNIESGGMGVTPSGTCDERNTIRSWKGGITRDLSGNWGWTCGLNLNQHGSSRKRRYSKWWPQSPSNRENPQSYMLWWNGIVTRIVVASPNCVSYSDLSHIF